MLKPVTSKERESKNGTRVDKVTSYWLRTIAKVDKHVVEEGIIDFIMKYYGFAPVASSLPLHFFLACSQIKTDHILYSFDGIIGIRKP